MSIKISAPRFGCSRLRTQRAGRPRLRGWQSPRNGRAHVGSKAKSRRLKPLKPLKRQHLSRLAGAESDGGRCGAGAGAGSGAGVPNREAGAGAGGGAVVRRLKKVSRRARKERQRRRRAQKRKAEKRRRTQKRERPLRECGGPRAKPPPPGTSTTRSPTKPMRRTWTWTNDGREKRELEKVHESLSVWVHLNLAFPVVACCLFGSLCLSQHLTLPYPTLLVVPPHSTSFGWFLFVNLVGLWKTAQCRTSLVLHACTCKECK